MTYTYNLKYDTNEPMKQKLTHIENRSVIAKRGEEQGREKLGGWGQEIQTITHRVDGQEHPTVQHRELYSISWDKLQWKRI